MKICPQWVIYKYTNRINGKSYIGETKNFKNRHRNHGKAYSAKTMVFHRAVLKWGLSSFDCEIIDYASSKQESLEKESFYIKKYNTLLPHGYNAYVKGDYKKRVSGKSAARNISNASQRRRRARKGKYLGVFSEISYGRIVFYCLTIVRGKKYSKYFDTEEEAAEAYDKVNLFFRGISAQFNFPEKIQQYKREDLKKFVSIVKKGSRRKISKYKYVTFDKKHGKYYINYEGLGLKRIQLGSFDTELKAAKEVDRLILFFNLQKSTNFLQSISEEDILRLNKLCYKSSYYGVSLYKGDKKWLANGKFGRLKAFYNEKSAAIYHDWYVIHNAIKASLNFPEYRELYQKSEDEILIFVKQFEDEIPKRVVGVSLRRGRWMAYTSYSLAAGEKRVHIGYFKTREEAIKAREEYYQRLEEEKMNLQKYSKDDEQNTKIMES